MTALFDSTHPRRVTQALFLISVCFLAGCARLPQIRLPRAISAKHAASSTPDRAPRRVRVVSADVSPRTPSAGWRPSYKQSILAGAVAGGGAGAGVGLGVCTVSIWCPPCYAACVAGLGLGGAAVGAFGGQVAHRQLASDSANRMLPASDDLATRFHARVMATLAAQPGVSVEDGGKASLPFALDDDGHGQVTTAAPASSVPDDGPPPDRVLEVALTEIHVDALRKGGFEVAMKARARVRDPRAGTTGDVKKFDYAGKQIAEGGGIEAEASRIAEDAEHGMNEMAKDIHDELLRED